MDTSNVNVGKMSKETGIGVLTIKDALGILSIACMQCFHC